MGHTFWTISVSAGSLRTFSRLAATLSLVRTLCSTLSVQKYVPSGREVRHSIKVSKSESACPCPAIGKRSFKPFWPASAEKTCLGGLPIERYAEDVVKESCPFFCCNPLNPCECVSHPRAERAGDNHFGVQHGAALQSQPLMPPRKVPLERTAADSCANLAASYTVRVPLCWGGNSP
ncbi:hypothetical protein B0T25DRAFT_134628 [Lasiosphaeria hispida]|uniref:Uncharacterized protein n=1 Tax=Lasiosphaeria hispida TaxID=260671 RepID=A0AAJ0HK23_9PEZI|nr:hypothetical protein B0T25DRAFT_134628 [Lasiosphaeria hispida]